ncbi:MAG: hypothetical protein HY360_24845 [Verrucomicrobia bacterium]|nr:hypothetical protein [Verrucomicrobiota bacterium]
MSRPTIEPAGEAGWFQAGHIFKLAESRQKEGGLQQRQAIGQMLRLREIMYNDDLIAYLQPAPNQFNPHEWRDVCGSISSIRAEGHRLALRARLPQGLYCGRIETAAGGFDMTTLMVPMVRAPDGQKVLVGPWDLNHIENVMAVPMARACVNGKLKGGLWFEVPGPDQIAEGRLTADFGFEAECEETELTLEFVERDRQRINWSKVRSMELRKDNRSICPLLPASKRRPRVYVTAQELPGLRKRLLSDPGFKALVERLKQNELEFVPNSPVYVDLACLAYLVTGDKQIGGKIREKIVAFCRQPTWSGRPDPLLMGGDNDRGIGFKLGWAGLACEYLGSLFSKEEHRVILGKAEEYLQKMYDFTVLQRAYMGHPTIEPHSTGAWNGLGVACMCFYDDLAIARKALPFFHGLFCDSLKLFPPGGKTMWATYFPFHLVRYLAAAHTFGGRRPELSASPYLDNLGRALLACFETPNNQELQRGLRTKEYRYVTAYLSRFHPTDGIEGIYQAFVEQEQKTAGDVEPTFFDLLYAPVKPAKAAAFPVAPFFARDIGEIIGVARLPVPTRQTGGKKTIACSFSAGLKTGGKGSFSLLPHNREFTLPMAALDVTVDSTPVLINLNMCTFEQDSALTNTMCFEDGGMLTNHQYINGDIGPEKSGHIRRCFLNERFVYVHAVITETLHPQLKIRRAERIMIMDHHTGVIVLADSFEGDKPIRFATHLHCSGSITDLGNGRHRLTGGQAGLIAGFGGDRLSNEEKGEIFVTVLNPRDGQRVREEEPAWIPGYIYGINFTGKETFRDVRLPRFRRWRLEATQPVSSGAFLFALSAGADDVSWRENRICAPQGAWFCLGDQQPVRALNCECRAEAVLADENANKLVLIGARQIAGGNRKMEFAAPTDVELELGKKPVSGHLFASARDPVAQARGFRVGAWRFSNHHPRSSCEWTAPIQAA